MDAKELLPCPFCGVIATIAKVGRDWLTIRAEHEEDCALDSDLKLQAPQTQEGREWLTVAWNHRAAPVAPAAGVPSDAQPVAWRYLTPTGWHVVEDAGKAARIADYHEVRPLFEAAPASLTPLAAAGLSVVHQAALQIAIDLATSMGNKPLADALTDVLATTHGDKQS